MIDSDPSSELVVDNDDSNMLLSSNDASINECVHWWIQRRRFCLSRYGGFSPVTSPCPVGRKAVEWRRYEENLALTNIWNTESTALSLTRKADMDEEKHAMQTFSILLSDTLKTSSKRPILFEWCGACCYGKLSNVRQRNLETLFTHIDASSSGSFSK